MNATALLFCSFTLCALAQHPELKTGPNADLGGALLMPADDEWNRDVSKDEVDPLSEAIIREDMLELYVNDYLMNLKRVSFNGRIGFMVDDRQGAFKNISVWQSK